MNRTVNLRQYFIASLFIAVISGGTPVVHAESGMTDAEKAVEFQRKEEEIKRLKAQAGIKEGQDVEEGKSTSKSYKLPQRRDEKSASESNLGKRNVYSTDLKEKAAGKNKYQYKSLSRSNSVDSKNPLKNRKVGGVVGNTRLQRTRLKKVKIKNKYKLGGQLNK